MSGPNSFSTCRHPPHGGVGSSARVTTATASIERLPALTAAATALRSAHTDIGYEAFSMFAPANTSPSARTAAPTLKFEYGA
jgi:hypothetical protein